ncbi:MAG: hypothetical protein CMF49_03720 [Legionellales bacterium]|nr:hypothetical protein [Legionellales bacterium]
MDFNEEKTMRKKIIKWGVTAASISIIAAALISANIAQAEDSPNLPNSISATNSAENGINALGKLVLAQILRLFTFPDSNYNDYLNKTTVPVNAQQIALGQQIKPLAKNDTLSFLANNSLYVDNALDTQQQYAKVIPTTQQTAQQNAIFFNSGTLLNNMILKPGQAKAAQVYINFLADAGNPVPTPQGSWVNNGTSATTKYLNDLGTYNAQLSTGLNTLYLLFEERKPQTALGGKSALSYDAAAAERRMTPDWYTKITGKQFTPADVSRESLVIQAEQRYELFEIRMQLEQLNTTMTTLQLQLLQSMSKPALIAAEVNAKNGASSGS